MQDCKTEKNVYLYLNIWMSLKLAQQMAIDSFWWILALISDQTMHEGLN